MANPVVHFDIGCRDREKTNEFYTSLFGWSTSDYGPFSKAINTGSEAGIQGFMTALGHEPHNYVMIYAEVDDIGGTSGKGCVAWRNRNGSRKRSAGFGSFAWIKDIDENLVGLWKPTEKTASESGSDE